MIFIRELLPVLLLQHEVWGSNLQVLKWTGHVFAAPQQLAEYVMVINNYQ